jgi:signal transduction histidine kinase
MSPPSPMGAPAPRLDSDLRLADGTLENELRVAKLALLARRSNFNVSATVVNACLLCSLLYPTAPRIGLGIWGLLQLGGASWAYYSVHKRRPPPRGSQRGITRAAWTCTGAGVLLGSVVLLLEHTGDLARFLVFITLGAMASAASTTLAPIPRAAQGYIAGALVLPAAFWAYQGRFEYAVMAALSLSMLVFLVRNARVSHDAFLEGLGRAQQIGRLREQFQAEQAEWLDLSQAAEAFALLDPEDRLLLWNARFEQLVQPARVTRGVPYADLLRNCGDKPTLVDGKPVSTLEWLELRSALAERGGELLESYAGDAFYRVSAHRARSGRQVILAVNVTALKRTERALREGELALLQTQRMESVGVIAGGVAHDFNNLLTAVGGAAELLSASVSDPDDQELLRDITASVERGSRLTRQLLAYGRRQPQRPRLLGLNDLLELNLPLFRRLLPATVRIETTLSPELSQVHADPEQLEQVMLNLVLNARDALPRGGALRLSTRNVDGSIELCVADDGVGMSPETSARIFEPFFSTKERHHGSGLGLSAVQGIVRQSGGSVAVHSRPGEGTRMIVRLPMSNERGIESPRRLRHNPSVDERSHRLLVVDDEERVLEVTTRLLVRLGYRVVEASRPDVALGLLEQHRDQISLLLSDVVMPVMNGAELAAAARKLCPQLPVLFMSGYDPGLLEQFQAHDVLQKPFTLEQLGQAVTRALEGGPRGAQPGKVSGFVKTVALDDAADETAAKRG